MDIVKVFGSNLKKYRTAMGISQLSFKSYLIPSSVLLKYNR